MHKQFPIDVATVANPNAKSSFEGLDRRHSDSGGIPVKNGETKLSSNCGACPHDVLQNLMAGRAAARPC